MLLEPPGGLLLLDYSEDNYEIVLIDNIGLRTRSIYVLDSEKKKTLRDYVDKNLKREYIRYSKLGVT